MTRISVHERVSRATPRPTSHSDGRVGAHERVYGPRGRAETLREGRVFRPRAGQTEPIADTVKHENEK
ncbi:MAG: hypothetical protein AABW86_04730 [Candidatus Micrarchaeota archaeon]